LLRLGEPAFSPATRYARQPPTIASSVTIETAFGLLALEVLLVALFGIRRYGTPLNPLTFHALYETTLTVLLSGIVAYTLLARAPYSASHMVQTVALSGLYLLSFAAPFCLRGRLPLRAFAACMRMLRLHSVEQASRYRLSKFVLLLGCAMLCFAGLAIAGGGGILWLTDTRTAYLRFRTGAGYFWLLSIWFTTTAFIYYLWARRPTGMRLAWAMSCFTLLAYLTGSKLVILCMFVTTVTYYEFLVRHISTWKVALAGVGALAGFFVLLVLQSSMTLLNLFSYFEHFDVTTQFLARFNEFGYHWGAAKLSELWFYVPRALYPDKPLEYGGLLVPARLYPGAYEQGYAPGFLSWSLGYLDFGWLGVAVAGWVRGIFNRAVYEYYLAHRFNLFAFLFMMQFCLWWVLAYATFPITVLWSIAMALLFRLVLTSRHEALGVTRDFTPAPG
jgi:hypothetical protein